MSREMEDFVATYRLVFATIASFVLRLLYYIMRDVYIPC